MVNLYCENETFSHSIVSILSASKQSKDILHSLEHKQLYLQNDLITELNFQESRYSKRGKPCKAVRAGNKCKNKSDPKRKYHYQIILQKYGIEFYYFQKI